MFELVYPCQERHLKSAGSLIVSVLTADYALIVGAYQAVLWVAVIFQKRRKHGELRSVFAADI
jgi:hypothetical protein